MRAVILEVNSKNTIILDDTGCYSRIQTEQGFVKGQEIFLSAAEKPAAASSPHIMKRIFRLRPKYYLCAVAILATLVGGGIFTKLWDSPSYAIYLQTNPSIRIEANSFDQIISYSPHNPDGAELLENSKPKGSIFNGMLDMITAADDEGEISPNGISITVVTDDDSKFNTLKKILNFDAFGFSCDMDCVSKAEEAEALKQGEPPLIYHRALAVCEKFPEVSMEKALQCDAGDLLKVINGELSPDAIF